MKGAIADPAEDLPIAVDAMGGDNAPSAVVIGAREAAERLGLRVALVGRPDAIGPAEGLEIWPAAEVIDMGEDAVRGVRRKRGASVLRAAESVRDGRASAMVSAGHSGASLASAVLRMGCLPGVVRPAMAAVLPVPGSGPTLLVDAGANVNCAPRWLLQFAQMGAAYASHHLGVAQPRIGLLSNGEEEGKGTTLVRTAHTLLSGGGVPSPARFIGNVEGHDVLSDRVDVVVTDGFTGNVVLKTVEGCLRAVRGSLGSRPGGALLLGVNGVCVIGHGASSPAAVADAVRMAAEAVSEGVISTMRAALGHT